MTLVIGLMSGTSVDGIDAALVDIQELDSQGLDSQGLDNQGAHGALQVTLLAGRTYPYPPALRAEILAVCGGASRSLEMLARLDDDIAQTFAEAALSVQDGKRADLIGSHGQTVYHRPPEAGQLGYTLQLGRGMAIAQRTGIPTVSNFRVNDIGMGGQGAPLVPKVDAYLLSDSQYGRCVQNIGGIGNVTYLPPRKSIVNGDELAQWEQHIVGWDTGPGNVLIDLAVQHFSQGTLTYDADGQWAAQGTPCQSLISHWMQDSFFQQPPPKSTGREHFGPAFLQQCLADGEREGLTSADLLATLTDLTARSIVESYRAFLPQMPDQVLVCGGGGQNTFLKQRLQTHLETIPLFTTTDFGLNTDYKEAIAFAVLAYWNQQQIPGNLPSVTGAVQPVVLGELAHPVRTVHDSMTKQRR